jgi:hypothetical protein
MSGPLFRAAVLEDLERLISSIEDDKSYACRELAELRYILLAKAGRLLTIERSIEEESDKP